MNTPCKYHDERLIINNLPPAAKKELFDYVGAENQAEFLKY